MRVQPTAAQSALRGIEAASARLAEKAAQTAGPIDKVTLNATVGTIADTYSFRANLATLRTSEALDRELLALR